MEWRGLLIMGFDEDVDGLLQRHDRVEDAAFQAAFGELGEEALDSIQPGAGRRDEMKRPAGMARQPCPNLVRLVGGIVVEDDVDDLAGRDLALDGIEKADEFLVAVLLSAFADHRAFENVERGEQRGVSCAYNRG